MMTGPRRSTRVANNMSSSPVSDKTSPRTGSKRKAVASPKGKSKKKVQKTLEEMIPDSDDVRKDVDMRDAPKEAETVQDAPTKVKAPSDENKVGDEPKVEPKEPAENENATENGGSKSNDTTNESSEEPKQSFEAANAKANGTVENGITGSDEVKDEPAKEDQASKTEESANEKVAKVETSKPEEAGRNGTHGELVEDSKARESEVPSNLIEKGIIYFFTRGRVGIEEPESVQDLQRTYFVMRPIPTGAKLGEGAIDDTKKNRLVALPKKVFPKSGKDRFMAFVEKGKASMDQLKKEFFQGSDYETKTLGTRHAPAITPIGEGVYAITKVGRSTHLVYMLTIPHEPGPVQDEMGIREKGSFVLSLKNPTAKGPANAQLPQDPEFPQSILDDFNGLSWMPVHKSEYLDYPNAQVLLIGEGQHNFGSAVEPTEKDKKDDTKETPEEEIEKLEAEDQIRIEALHGEDAVFNDLHISKKDYPKVITTW